MHACRQACVRCPFAVSRWTQPFSASPSRLPAPTLNEPPGSSARRRPQRVLAPRPCWPRPCGGQCNSRLPDFIFCFASKMAWTGETHAPPAPVPCPPRPPALRAFSFRSLTALLVLLLVPQACTRRVLHRQLPPSAQRSAHPGRGLIEQRGRRRTGGAQGQQEQLRESPPAGAGWPARFTEGQQQRGRLSWAAAWLLRPPLPRESKVSLPAGSRGYLPSAGGAGGCARSLSRTPSKRPRPAAVRRPSVQQRGQP